MTWYRLKITEQHFDELRKLTLADLPNEAGAFALAGVGVHAQGTDILVRRPIAVPREHFYRQTEYHLGISSAAVNGLMALCESNKLGAILCHSHSSNTPYSPSDDFGEARIFTTLRQFVPSSAPTASLLFYPGGVRGRVWIHGSSTPIILSEIHIIGSRIQRWVISPDNKGALKSADIELFNRQVLAFGAEGQAALSQSRVGIVGVGGTGSAVAEQLTRLGVGDLLLIDHDSVEPSNLTRMYGTFYRSVPRCGLLMRLRNKKKVNILATHLKQIRPSVNVTTVPANVVLQQTASTLRDRDVIFLCTDEHWGRSIVNTIGYQYLIPVINLGVKIVPKKENKEAYVIGNVDILRPGVSCLWCREVLRAERISAESMPKKARVQLRQEGYVEGIDDPTPAVISFTTTVASLAVTCFLQLLTDFMGTAGNIERLNCNLLNCEVRRGRSLVKNSCLCSQVTGRGDLQPLPAVTDLSFLNA